MMTASTVLNKGIVTAILPQFTLYQGYQLSAPLLKRPLTVLTQASGYRKEWQREIYLKMITFYT